MAHIIQGNPNTFLFKKFLTQSWLLLYTYYWMLNKNFTAANLYDLVPKS